MCSKMKCDGVQPACGGWTLWVSLTAAICKVYKEECIYNPEADGRRSTPKAYVSALEERVRVLERTLRSHGLDAGTGSGNGSGEVKIEREDFLPVDTGLDRLKVRRHVKALTNSSTRRQASSCSMGRRLCSMERTTRRHHMRHRELAAHWSVLRCCGREQSSCPSSAAQSLTGRPMRRCCRCFLTTLTRE